MSTPASIDLAVVVAIILAVASLAPHATAITGAQASPATPGTFSPTVPGTFTPTVPGTVSPSSACPTTGEPCGAANKYVEYLPSSGLPVILCAPHGGLEEPADISNRDAGCWSDRTNCTWTHNCGAKNDSNCAATTVTDIYTLELAREVRQRLCELFDGACPAAILNLLSRSKFDANRDRDEATFNVPIVLDAFDTFHRYIDNEKEKIRSGLFVDIHGQNHPTEWAELGYLPRGATLDKPDPIDPNMTSIRSLAATHSGLNFDELLRGNESFGGYLQAEGFRSVPSPNDRSPIVQNQYFNGGYNTRRHGSLNGGQIDAIQIESAHAPRQPNQRARYARAIACSIKRFFCKYYLVVPANAASQNTGDVVGVRNKPGVCSPSKLIVGCGETSAGFRCQYPYVVFSYVLVVILFLRT